MPSWTGERPLWVTMWLVVAAVLLGVVAACASPGATSTPLPPAAAAATPADVWQALLQATPFPYSIPLPPAVTSPVDGTYVKVEPSIGDRVPCKRCPDYAIEQGTWKLYLGDGIFRVWHESTGWRSLGSFTAFTDPNAADQIDQLVLFNDPYCPGVVGLYNWRLEEGALHLEVVGDTCSINLRGANLSHRPWLSCAPPNAEAGVTDHWQKPPGCE